MPRAWSATDSKETNRQQINAWIRTPGNFDGVIDFDAALLNPQNPQAILPPYVNSVDQTHPTDAGYAVMGHAIDLAPFGVTAPHSTVDDAATGTGATQFNYHGSNWGSCANSCSSSTQYAGTEHWDAIANDTLTISFTGTGIDFYAERGPGSGLAGFTIDSGSETVVDTYTSLEAGNQFVWSSGVLTSGSHTLSVRVTGQHDSNATSAYVLPDRVDIFAATTTVDDYVTGNGE